MTLPINIRDARLAKGLTQQELADIVGIRQNFLSDLESGKRTPSDTTRSAISSVLGDVLFPGDERPGNEVRKIVTKGTAIVPLYRTMIRAGSKGQVFEDSVEEFDVARHYLNTCVYEVSGDSMLDAGIEEGDRVVVRLGYRFMNRDIILCKYNDQLMLKGAAIINEEIWLFPANPHHHPWKCSETDEFQCIGTLVEIIKKPHREWWSKHNFNKLKG